MTNGTRMVLGLCLALLSTACRGGSPRRHGHGLMVRVVDDRGTSLPAATVSLDGLDIGETDASGELGASLQARDGQRVAISVACPPGYQPLDAAKELVLRRMRGSDDSAAAELEVALVCSRDERLAILIVRVDGPGGLPVCINGEERGRTDASGAAHIAVRGAPGSTLELQLETHAHPHLQPQSPTFVFAIPDRDRFVLFEQAFAERQKRRRRQRKPEVEAPVRPVRIN